MAFLIFLAALAFPGTAMANALAVAMRPASDVTATSATLNGIVNPQGSTTTYWFEYGTTTAYGSRTPTKTLQGNSDKQVSARITGLSPSTTYLFRIQARSQDGAQIQTGPGEFTTLPQGSAAVTIAATPATVTFGKAVTIAGQVAGRPGERVELEHTSFPFTDPFRNVSQVTADSAGNYAFPGIAPTVNTRYHAVAKSPQATSADITVRVRPRVGLRLGDSTPASGQRVRFRGTVLPAHDGSQVLIQRRTSAGWKTIRTRTLVTATPAGGVARSKYGARIRIRRSGSYRAVLPAHDDHARGKSGKRRAVVH